MGTWAAKSPIFIVEYFGELSVTVVTVSCNQPLNQPCTVLKVSYRSVLFFQVSNEPLDELFDLGPWTAVVCGKGSRRLSLR